MKERRSIFRDIFASIVLLRGTIPGRPMDGGSVDRDKAAFWASSSLSPVQLRKKFDMIRDKERGIDRRCVDAVRYVDQPTRIMPCRDRNRASSPHCGRRGSLAPDVTRDPSCHGCPIGVLPRPARPARGLQISDPAFQMRMPGRPRQHRAGDAEIIVLPRRAGVDRSALTKLDLQIGELLIGAAHRPVRRQSGPDRTAIPRANSSSR